MQRDFLFHEPLNSYLNQLLDLYEACEVEGWNDKGYINFIKKSHELSQSLMFNCEGHDKDIFRNVHHDLLYQSFCLKFSITQ